MNLQRQGDLLNAALEYGSKGYAHYPVTITLTNSGKKDAQPHVSWGSESSTDPAQTWAWFGPGAPYEHAGLGIDCHRSGIAVVDLDGQEGIDGWEKLCAEHGAAPAPWQRTRSGGRHYFYRQRPEAPIYNTAGKVAPGIDVRGAHDPASSAKTGGTVFAAPTRIHGVDGQAYEWGTPLPPVDQLPLIPEWLPALAKKKSQERREGRAGQRMVMPGRTSALRTADGTPVDPKTGLILEGFLGTPEGLRRYVEKKLQEIRDLPVNGPGESPVNDIAFELSHYVPHQLDLEELRSALRAAVDTWEDGHDTGYAGIDHGLRDAGNQEPKVWEERERSPFGDGRTGHARPGSSAGIPGHTWDDFGLADRLVDRHGLTIRWVTDTEQWAAYEGGRWSFRGAPSKVWARCIETIRAMDGEVELYDSKDRDAFALFLRKSRSRLSVAAMRDIAQGDPRIATEMAMFDRQKHLLNIRNGVLDLEAGKLLPHSPDLYLMQQAGVKFDPEALAPRWLKFLERSMPDQARRDYLARIAGYTLSADTSEQCIFVHVGTGANGKSVYLEVLMSLLGDYAQSVPSSTLLASKGEGVPNDVARMVGKRLLSTVETAAGKKLDEELVKQLTGGDTVSARFMRAEFFDFKPVGKIHLATNHLPHVSAGYGTARRLQDIGWDVTIPEEERDRSLAERIIADELSGVLNWALKGYADWRLQGLSVPEAVRERTKEHLESSDPIGLWLTECIEIHGDKERPNLVLEDAEVESSDLYANYRAWTEAMGMKPMTLMSLVNALKERGLRKGQNSRSRRGVFFGVRIASTRVGS